MVMVQLLLSFHCTAVIRIKISLEDSKSSSSSSSVVIRVDRRRRRRAKVAFIAQTQKHTHTQCRGVRFQFHSRFAGLANLFDDHGARMMVMMMMVVCSSNIIIKLHWKTIRARTLHCSMIYGLFVL